MEFVQDGCDRSGWLKGAEKPRNPIHIVDTMPDFHYTQSGLKSMCMDVVKPTEDQRLNRSSKTGLLLRDNETISGPCSLSTAGIVGAQVPPLYKFTNRGAHAFSNLSKTWEDLPKSTPKVLIPEHVNRPSNILDARDIKGTSPHPKNMKIGNEARNTNPVDPCYTLPSYPEPYIPPPKFLKDSLDVGDIEGARPSSRHMRDLERGSLCVNDIEGSQPGWKPLHRRQLGKECRNLCLKVEDINGPVEVRVVRPSTAEVYQDVEGSHSRDLTVRRRPGTPHTLSLCNDDIEGANAGSASWEGTTRRRKEFAKSCTRSLKEQKDAEELAVKTLTSRMQEQLRQKGLQPRDIVASFHQLDRQKSGKLDMNEVTRAFKTLRLNVDPSDLHSISKAFIHPAGDGYLDYWNLLKHLIPIYPKQERMQRDTSNNVAKSINQGIKSNGCQKPCYDPAMAADVVARRDCRVPDGEGGTQFQAFNSGRPINHSRYLKDPSTKYAMQPESNQWPQIQIGNYRAQDGTQPQIQRVRNTAQSVTQPQIQTEEITVRDEDRNNVCSRQQPSLQTGMDMTQNITREVPVLSVLPGSVTQPTWANKDATFQEITQSKPRKVKGREDSIFSKFRAPGFALGENNACSVPIFYKLKGMNNYETKPLPIGGPFWPGIVEVQPENLAPPQTKTPSTGPLPMGAPFWSGVERPQSAPRISLRRDYPVPPLVSEMNCEINLRKAGQKEKVLKTWVETVGDGPSVTTFVGEGDKVLSRPGMQGSLFSRPSSAILPHRYEHPSTWKCGNQPVGRPQSASSLAHSCPSSAWFPESFPMERARPQTVNSIARGSPAENLLSNNHERKIVSAMKRPSTAQSVPNSVRSVVTFSPFPSRPCTPCPASADRSPCADLASRALSTRIRTQSQLQNHGSNRGNGNRRSSRSIPVGTQRHQAQLWEDMESVRLLV